MKILEIKVFWHNFNLVFTKYAQVFFYFLVGCFGQVDNFVEDEILLFECPNPPTPCYLWQAEEVCRDPLFYFKTNKYDRRFLMPHQSPEFALTRILILFGQTQFSEKSFKTILMRFVWTAAIYYIWQEIFFKKAFE